MDNYTFRNRLKRIRNGISRSGADCLIVTKPANVTYATGFTGDDSWAIVSQKKVILVTDSRYTEQAAQQCPLCRIVRRNNAMTEAVAKLLKHQGGIKLAAVEKTTSVADFEGLKRRLSCRLRTAEGIIESVRRRKDKCEIAAIRAAAKIARRAFEETIKRIKPGLSENEVAGIIDFQIRKFGGKNSFETIAAFGPNAARPHHQPTAKKLHVNDTVLIDFGVRYNGYCCDLTRCFPLGRVHPLYKKAFAAVENARDAALKLVRAGVEVGQVDASAKKVIKNAGLPVYGHGTGHGLGLEVHELPPVSDKVKGNLQAGDVITIEPAVYITGRFGVRIEDDFLVTENGYVALSQASER
jgi:Xaa-Pro aminopeptidase